LSSAKDVFESMVFLALEEVEDGAPDSEDAAILGTITFTGDVKGCLSVCFSQACAGRITASMLCMDSPDTLTDEDVVDAVGEIANLVMGLVKTRLQNEVETISISIPSVVLGKELRTRTSDGTVRVTIDARVGREHHATFSLLYRAGGATSGGIA
jgi:chemotaxis protein CheX